jgi:CubicO group peptidase (beta-lactamase class C family)
MRIYFLLLICLVFAACNTNPGKNTEEKIGYVVKKAYEDGDFTGSVLVTERGKVIYHNSLGMADAKGKRPITDSAKFLIGSLSKPFTAVLILQFVEQGKINPHDKIFKYFKSLTKAKSGNITIHQLLTHTSGIKEIISETHPFKESDLLNNAFNAEPGADFEYSNTGYVILKNIAEIASGKTYADLIKEQIFIPAGMNSSGVAHDLKLVSNLAVGYKTPSQAEPAVINYPLQIVDGAGSIYATATDLSKFDRALAEGKLLSAKSMDLMLQQHVKEKYGYGWYLRERGGVWDVSYHKGNLPGYTGFLSRQKTNDQAIIILANADNLDLADLEKDIAKILKAAN